MSKAIATTRLDITTPQQAMDYLRHMHAAGMVYHLDDDPADSLSHFNLTTDQLANIEHNVAQLFTVDWSSTKYDTPFDFLISEGLSQ